MCCPADSCTINTVNGVTTVLLTSVVIAVAASGGFVVFRTQRFRIRQIAPRSGCDQRHAPNLGSMSDQFLSS